MSDLLSLLSMGAAGIAAQNAGVSVATNNVANVNTEGYSRQRVDLESLQAAPLVGGVRSGSPDRIASDLLSGQARSAGGALAMSTAFVDALNDLEGRMTSSGPTVDEQLSNMFGKFSQVSATPTDVNLRDGVVASARDLVAGIQRRAADVASARKEADSRIGDAAVEATKLAKQLADANKSVRKSNDPALRDQRDQTAKQLAALVGGQARVDSDGQMRFVLDGGAVLVDGIHASSLTATRDPATNVNKLEVVDGPVRRDVTSAIGGGKIGGELRFRDTTAVKAAGQLDQLAFDLTKAFNTTASAHAGLDGVSGRNMFTPLASVTGAASLMQLDPGLAADSTQLATATPGGGPGNNAGALALFALNSQQVASGNTRTPVDAALDIVSSVALDGSQGKADLQSDTLVNEHLATLRDSLSGVDTQEELTNLSRFEHAASAMTKFVSTIDNMLTNLITNL
jgi:flagellar hook-associated protein 1 FlgK